MSVSLHHVGVDAHDLPGLARFWSQVLDWPILSEREREVVIGPADDAPVGICFMPSPDDKVVKNRVHLDVWPTDRTRDEMVDHLTGIGATLLADRRRPDGTGWVVMADPEGNEFCVERGTAEREPG